MAIEIEYDEDFKSMFRPMNNIKFDKFKLEISDDIFTIGFPYKLKGGGHFPIWKRRSVVSEPDINDEGVPKFFADTASRPRMSGSPVIFKRNGIHEVINEVLEADTKIGEIKRFVSIYSGRILGKTELEARLGVVWKKEVIDEIIDGNTKDATSLW